MDDLHRAAAQYVRRAHHQRIADLLGQLQRLVLGACGAVRRLAQAQLLQQLLEALAVLGRIDHVGTGADDRHAIGLQVQRQLQRSLAAVLHDHADRLFLVDDLEHVLERQRLEVQAVGGVVVGRHGLRVAVDHDGLVAILAQRERRVHAAVVEFDALADPVRTAAQHHDLALVGRVGLALAMLGLVGRVHVGGVGGELGRAGIDALVDRTHVVGQARFAHGLGVRLHQPGQAPVGEALLLQVAQLGGRQAGQRAGLDLRLGLDDVLDLGEEPRVDVGLGVHLLERHAQAERIADVPDAVRARLADLLDDLVAIGRLLVQPVDADLQAAQRLLERLLEGAAHRHHLAHRLHLRGQVAVGLREFLEGKARHLGDHVVDRRLERRRGLATGDLVLQLVQRVADRQLGGDLGDREAGGLRGQRRRTRHARVHLDHDHPAVLRIDRELHVGAAGIDADLAQHRQRGVAQQLVFLVGQGLRRRDGDRVAGMDAHRVQVLDRADDDAVVLLVADHFHLVLFPAQQRFLDQQLARRRQVQAALADLLEFLAVVGDAAAGAAQRERRADHDRIAAGVGLARDLRLDGQRLFHRMRDAGLGRTETDLGHRVLELLPVLGLVDRLGRRADQLDLVLVEHAVAVQVQRAVQRGLATHGRQDRIGALLGDDALDHFPGDGLDVGHIGGVRVGHDGRRVRIDQDDLEPFLAQRLARLRAGIVELAGLADDDGARADDQDALDVCAFWHCTLSLSAGPRSLGAGAPRRISIFSSGWPSPAWRRSR